jgi:uncharacterized membrane protein YqjE
MPKQVKNNNLKKPQVGVNKPLTEKQLTEPLSPYLNDAYIALVSVVEGVAFAALFYVISEEQKLHTFSLAFIAKAIVALILIILMWHRYIVHNPYNAWRITIWDTTIPIVFAALQIALALSLFSETYWFSIWLMSISLTGVLAYCNSIWRYNKSETHELFREHYHTQSTEFANNLFSEIQKFHYRSRDLLFLSFVINAGVLFFNDSADNTWSEVHKSILVSVVALIIISYSLVVDLRRHLNKSTNSFVSRYGGRY